MRPVLAISSLNMTLHCAKTIVHSRPASRQLQHRHTSTNGDNRKKLQGLLITLNRWCFVFFFVLMLCNFSRHHDIECPAEWYIRLSLFGCPDVRIIWEDNMRNTADTSRQDSLWLGKKQDCYIVLTWSGLTSRHMDQWTSFSVNSKLTTIWSVRMNWC